MVTILATNNISTGRGLGGVLEITHKWHIVDRKKELIKVPGFQVNPPELEAMLPSHPLIVDSAVIGVVC